jgi:hypothetical protein
VKHSPSWNAVCLKQLDFMDVLHPKNNALQTMFGPFPRFPKWLYGAKSTTEVN